MSKFPNKTPFELRKYFKKLSLSELEIIKQSYRTHFILLEEKLSLLNGELSARKTLLDNIVADLKAFQKTYDDIEVREAQYRQTPLKFSPMNIFKRTQVAIKEDILKKSQEVQCLIEEITNIEQKKTTAASELRILSNI